MRKYTVTIEFEPMRFEIESDINYTKENIDSLVRLAAFKAQQFDERGDLFIEDYWIGLIENENDEELYSV